ncbi:hypothetical protein A8C32_10405 [Flavivirga aquatica]|uniref:Uncharacterized protein n=1 Tax=Flavivirga aquatica TaxID=1849968 RepID=A0A1E5TCS0_9FLAO|nr:hypothetical protein [Flavivirga aquatica]OEK09137.1 hypothetical protein A8C32_10405 [Flavivirga aquatica]
MKYLNQLIFFVFLIATLLVSCGDSKKSGVKQEYKYFSLKQQGWKSKRVNQFVNNINYTATEVPLQYYLLKSTKGNYKTVDSLYKISSKERIIEVEFQHVKQTDLLLSEYTNKSYDDAVKYMAFTIEKDFTVVTSSNDTISCSGVNFERNFKVAPFKRVLLYFNNINHKDNIKLIYQDQLFGNGIIKFNFNETPLKL